MKRNLLLLTFHFLFLVFIGCIYNFTGFMRGNIKSIYIPLFENTTIKYGIEQTVTEKIINAFIKDNRLKVYSDKEKAGSVLLGKITSYERNPFSYDASENVKDYKVAISIELVYKDSKEETIFEKKIDEWATYSIDETEEDGIDRLAEKIAHDILQGVTGGW